MYGNTEWDWDLDLVERRQTPLWHQCRCRQRLVLSRAARRLPFVGKALHLLLGLPMRRPGPCKRQSPHRDHPRFSGSGSVITILSTGPGTIRLVGIQNTMEPTIL